MNNLEAINKRIADLDSWLKDQPVNVKQEQMHLDENTREQLYWHYGYMVGLRDSMKALS